MKTEDIKTLSKRKKVVRAYLGRDGKLNQETYPIVYGNASYIYFMLPGQDELTKYPLDRVLDDLPPMLVMAQFHPGRPQTFAYYWNPAPAERLRRMETTFVQSVIRTTARDLGAEIVAAQEQVRHLMSKLESMETEKTALLERIDRERTAWEAIAQAEADTVNMAVGLGEKITSTFVHPGAAVDERLRLSHNRTATVRNAYVRHEGPYSELWCTVVFADTGTAPEFEVPAHTLKDLYLRLISE